MQVRVSDMVARNPQTGNSHELSLPELTEAINSLTALPSLDQVMEWFSRVYLRPRDYQSYRVFADHNYARNLIARSDYAEMLLLCWHSGQRTPIHDHGGSIGVILVCEGMMTETMFERAPEGNVHPYNTYRRGTGAVTGADVPDIHQLLNLEAEGKELVTLHCYSPPLSVLNTYSQSSSRVGHWRERYYTGGAGI
ncbi:MAG: cysteine dioxygenase [Blastocatellia bacterium]